MRVHIELLCLCATFFSVSQSARIYFHPTTTSGLYYILTEDPKLTSTLQSLSDKPTVNLTADVFESSGELDLNCNGKYMNAIDEGVAGLNVCNVSDPIKGIWISSFNTAEAYFCSYDDDVGCDASMWHWADAILNTQCPPDIPNNVQGGWIRDYNTFKAAGRDKVGSSECVR